MAESRLTPDEMYGVAKQRAISLAMMMEQMANDERVAPEHRQMFGRAMALVDAAIAIMRNVPFCEVTR